MLFRSAPFRRNRIHPVRRVSSTNPLDNTEKPTFPIVGAGYIRPATHRFRIGRSGWKNRPSRGCHCEEGPRPRRGNLILGLPRVANEIPAVAPPPRNDSSKEALNNEVRADSRRFWLRRKFWKCGNTGCISHFQNCADGAKDSLFSRNRIVQSFLSISVCCAGSPASPGRPAGGP